jgi:hypothetical protein
VEKNWGKQILAANGKQQCWTHLYQWLCSEVYQCYIITHCAQNYNRNKNHYVRPYPSVCDTEWANKLSDFHDI